MRYPEKNCYDSLGIPKNATPRQIKQAYYTQMKYFHPDVYPGSPEIADAKSKEINAAYALLSNPLERERYDAWLFEQERRAAYERMQREKARQAAEEARRQAAEKAKKEEEERRRAAEKARKEAEERRRAAEKAQKEAEERRRTAENARKEEEERRRAAEQTQKEAEEAFYNTWWHEYAAYEAAREAYASADREPEVKIKQEEKRLAKLKFWGKFQIVVVCTFLSLGPVAIGLYLLLPKSEPYTGMIMAPMSIFILVGTYVSAAAINHLEGQRQKN